MLEAYEAHLREHPDDWASWLVYADHLLDRGDVRGELIVLEHKLATQMLTYMEREVFRARVDAIQKEQYPRWLEGLQLRHVELEWAHGFLRRVTLIGNDVVEALEKLLTHPASHLLSTVCFRSLAPQGLERLLRVTLPPGRLPVMQFERCYFYREEVQAIARSELLPSLLSLEFSSTGLGQEGLQTLLAGKVDGLLGLALWNENLDITCINALAQARGLQNLRRLSLGATLLGLEGARALAFSVFTQLTHLELRECRLNADRLGALFSTETLRGLTHLDLANNVLRDAGAMRLAEVGLPALAQLNLSLNNIGDEGALALAESTGLGSLVALNLWGNGVGALGATALKRSPRLSSLRSIEVGQNPAEQERVWVPITRDEPLA